jgi:SAM-dependent methyltransferase
MTSAHCQSCGAPLTLSLIDLGRQPLSNAFVPADRGATAEKVYPLHARVCDQCWLVQVDRVVPPEEIFTADYAYFSSFSESWLAHCRQYVGEMIERFALGSQSKVVEVASNDGYMLQYFVQAKVPCLGVEPSANVAQAAREKGVPTEIAFFGRETADRLRAEGHAADLLASKNVLAHVPDINDFVAGVARLLKPEGVYTVEFPHLLNLIQQVQFDTIYHEHFTYLSLLAIDRIFQTHGLRIFDVEEVPTHGGSLRVLACLATAQHQTSGRVAALLERERLAGLDAPDGYADFTSRVEKVRQDLIAFLRSAQAQGKAVAGYGAAAKGNTLFNYCRLGPADIPFVADRSPAKQGRLTPGSHIPVVPAETIAQRRPDYILIVPWNLREEIAEQLSYARSWGAQFVTVIPELVVQP